MFQVDSHFRGCQRNWHITEKVSYESVAKEIHEPPILMSYERSACMTIFLNCWVCIRENGFSNIRSSKFLDLGLNLWQTPDLRLDPFHFHSNDEIWRQLSDCHVAASAGKVFWVVVHAAVVREIYGSGSDGTTVPRGRWFHGASPDGHSYIHSGE